MLEVTNGITLGLFGAEERNGGLGRDGGSSWGFWRSDNNKAVSLGLPGKVNNSVLDRVDNFDRNALLLYTENLEGSSLRFLRFGVSVDLDANVGRIRLPVELGIRDAEQIQRPDDLLRGNAHQADLGGVAANFRGPVAK